MLERGLSLGNTLGPNIFKDDKTALGYYALAKCIVGVEHEGKIKHPSATKSLSAFGLFESKSSKEGYEKGEIKRSNKRIKFVVENLVTGKKEICNGRKEVSDMTGIKEIYVSTYVIKNASYKNTWRIYKANKEKIASNSRYMQITNIENGQVIEFESLKKTANFLGKATSTIIYHVERKSLVCGWKVEYLD